MQKKKKTVINVFGEDTLSPNHRARMTVFLSGLSQTFIMIYGDLILQDLL